MKQLILNGRIESCASLAKMCKVTPASIYRWADKGWSAKKILDYYQGKEKVQYGNEEWNELSP